MGSRRRTRFPGKAPPQTPSLKKTWIAAAAIFCAALASYANSFSVPFLFDDRLYILDNPGIKNLSPLGETLFPGTGQGLRNRPLLHLSLALNWALWGENPWGYHLVNLTIHFFCACLLFGLVHRILQTDALRPKYPETAFGAALFAALAWVAHPLNTQAVTYIKQRSESLMGLFFLLTLYAAARGWEKQGSKAWHAVAALAMIAGALTKEVIVAAPLCVLLYDRVFHSKSGFWEQLTASRTLYLGLALGWAVLFAILFFPVERGAGTDIFPPNWWRYSLIQPGVVVHYLKLVFWPSGLCLDTSWPMARMSEGAFLLPLALGLFVAGLWLAWERRPPGFCLAVFFLVLAPSSSLLPQKVLVAEHRMYLALACLAGLFAAMAARGLEIFLKNRQSQKEKRHARVAMLVLGLSLTAVLSLATFNRNHDYRSEVAIWSDTVAKCPDNPRARLNLGTALLDVGRLEAGMVQLRETLRLRPDHVLAHYNLANALVNTGQASQCFYHYGRALELDPGFESARVNLSHARNYFKEKSED